MQSYSSMFPVRFFVSLWRFFVCCVSVDVAAAGDVCCNWSTPVDAVFGLQYPCMQWTLLLALLLKVEVANGPEDEKSFLFIPLFLQEQVSCSCCCLCSPVCLGRGVCDSPLPSALHCRWAPVCGCPFPRPPPE